MKSTIPYRAGERILRVAEARPARPALVIDDETWSYGELVAAAGQLASRFPAFAEGDEQPITAVMAERHASSYVGILAARLAGHAYVPLNVNHPSQRNATILVASGAQRVICGANAKAALAEILAAASVEPDALPVIDCGEYKRDFETAAASEHAVRHQSVEDLAYILFTSGSTGNPKGVPIQNAQLEAYLAAAGGMIDIQPHDRFSQTFELTFDLSVHDLFLSWENGAALVVASEKELRMPAAYIQRHHITCWFSVPSLAYQVRLQEDLRPGAFPSLRSSLFCGEALPTVVATEWAAAAPNSVVENWYGPTEATIACSRFVLSDAPVEDDTVPIGTAFDKMELLVLDENRLLLPAGESGELFLAGAQVATGYLNDPEKTTASFMTLPDGKKAYRTGDRAVLGEDGNVRFLGRVDNQVKVRGFRIELGEIEAALRAASGGLNAIAMAWPGGAEIATSVVAAFEADTADIDGIQAQAEAMLPDYMVPATIFCVPEFPKNASGKVDRRALGELLDARARADVDTTGLGEEAAFLLRSILRHSPLLSRDNLLGARNLFDAGMDSIAFISFTTDVEHQFGLALDQDTVIQLSEMSFDAIVREVRGETRLLRPGSADEASPSFVDRIRKIFGIPRLIQKQRANRALQFIERFGGYLDEHGAPDVLAFGSSGTFRAIVPAEFEPAIAINAGFPAVNAFGMRMMCDFIKQECDRAGVRIPLVIYEFDPMQVSTTPPSGDINLGPDYFEGNVISLRGKNTSLEFQWLVDSRGAWNAPEEAQQKQRKPNWVRERDRVIAGVYLGEVEFEPQAVEAWYAGARTLQSIADRVVCFLHPADREMTDEINESVGSNTLVIFTAEITATLGIEVIPWESFDLEPADFLDINHMNARGGREKLSRQLAERVAPRGESV